MSCELKGLVFNVAGAYPSCDWVRGRVHLGRSPVHHGATQRQIPTMHVFGRWEEAGVPGENPQVRGTLCCEATVLTTTVEPRLLVGPLTHAAKWEHLHSLWKINKNI